MVQQLEAMAQRRLVHQHLQRLRVVALAQQRPVAMVQQLVAVVQQLAAPRSGF
jgi:hypothetical protein